MIDVTKSLMEIGDLRSPAGNTPAPGSYDIKQCIIQHGTGAEYEISDVVQEIHLFEDIEELGITGWLQIKDNINLIRNGLIIGEELLWLEFETAGATDAGLTNFSVNFRKHPLYIHKIEEITSPIGEQGTTTQSWLEYRLHFCSTEMITNDRIRVSKTYQGTIDKILKDVMEKDLGVTRKPLTITKTLDIHHFVVPNMRPFDFIDGITGLARCPTGVGVDGPQPGVAKSLFKGNHSDFLFFETSCRDINTDGGWFFIPAQRMSMSDAAASSGRGGGAASMPDLIFTLNNAATTTGSDETSTTGAGITGYAAAMLRSQSFEFVTTGDKWLTIENGSWCGTNIRHNGFTKSFDTYKSDYLKHLIKETYSHASKTPVYWPPNPAWRKISEWPNSQVTYGSSSPKSISNINTTTKRPDYPWRKGTPEHSLTRRLQLNHMLNYERVQCEMHGISGLQIGKMAQAEFPAIGLASGTPEETGLAGSEEVWPEDRNNNTWMITKVAHHIICAGSDPRYTTTMELANTMRKTGYPLPEYNSLTQPGSIST